MKQTARHTGAKRSSFCLDVIFHTPEEQILHNRLLFNCSTICYWVIVFQATILKMLPTTLQKRQYTSDSIYSWLWHLAQLLLLRLEYSWDFHLLVSCITACLESISVKSMGHFRITFSLFFKLSLGAHPFIWKWV